MKIGVIFAISNEVENINLPIKFVGIRASKPVFEITLNNTYYAIISGIGKIQSASATQKLIDCFSPDIILNLGLSGRINDKLDVGSLVIANEIVEYDVGFENRKHKTISNIE